MEKENKANRTRQVQFRMDPVKFRKLYTAIINDESIHSMADFFNNAADEYLQSIKSAEKDG